MMQLWTLLFFLHIPLDNDPRTDDGKEVRSLNVTSTSLPAPSSVSIFSFNMQHILSFQPGPGTPSNTNFTVEVVRPRKSSWRPVAACSQLMAGQTCNLTHVFKDPYDNYQTRVQAFTSTLRSNWTLSRCFQPLSDTVLGPPDVIVSGCGNCLIVHLTVPALKLQQNLQLRDLYKEVLFHVRRTRDGAQFTVSLPYKDDHVITYLQPGVEYCVMVSAKGLFNTNLVTSKAYCAFTSPSLPNSSNALYAIFILLSVFFVLGFLFIGLLVFGYQPSLDLMTHYMPRSQSNIFVQGYKQCVLPNYSDEF